MINTCNATCQLLECKTVNALNLLTIYLDGQMGESADNLVGESAEREAAVS